MWAVCFLIDPHSSLLLLFQVDDEGILSVLMLFSHNLQLAPSSSKCFPFIQEYSNQACTRP